MKKALTILMLALSVAAFTQNAPKAVVLDVFNKDGHVRQSTLAELKTNLAQAISAHRGYEGIVDEKVDKWLLAEGFANHPKLSKEQALWVANVADVSYAVMSEASIDNYGYLAFTVLLVDLDNYQVMTKETLQMDDKSDAIRKGCEALIKKIIPKLPEPPESVVENEQEPDNQTEAEEEEIVITEAMQPRQLTSQEAEDVARHLNRADVCIEMNYIDNAIKEYGEIVKMAPFWPNGYMYLANAYSQKHDEASLAQAIRNYKIFMQMTDDKELYYEAQDKLSRIEMVSELKAIEVEKEENLVGTWKTSLYDKYSGKPYFVLSIAKTLEPNKYQIVVSPKSFMYDNIVNAKAYAEIIDGKIGFSYTFQDTYIPKQSKYNAAGAVVNSLFRDHQLAAAIGNVIVESLREEDVGYTNIMDFDFITEVDIKDDFSDMSADAYMDGTCHFKGEHHQAGRNNVGLDTIYPCALLKGGERYPVFFKIEKKGLGYQYDDMVVKPNANELAKVLRMGGYVDAELDRIKKISKVTNGVGLALGSVGLSMMIGGGVMLAQDVYADSNTPLTVFCIGAVAAGLGIEIWGHGALYKSKNIKKLVTKHNQMIDENIRKYRQKDQASVSVNVGMLPTGAGVYVNF